MHGMSPSSRWLTAILVVALTGSVAWAQRHERHERKRVERAEISALEQQWCQAQLSEDIPEMDHLLADDFLGITAGGQVVTKTQQLDRMRSRQLDITKLDTTETKIKISGNLAVVTSLVKLDGTSNGAPLHGFFRSTRVYQRVPGDRWKITNFEATRIPDRGGMYGARSPQASSAVPLSIVPSSPPASRAESVFPLPQS